jgi:hypothetical protein
MASRASGTAKSRSRESSTINKHAPHAQPGTPRAHRGDTPEAKEQQRRQPKTHPTRAVGSRRKDK